MGRLWAVSLLLWSLLAIIFSHPAEEISLSEDESVGELLVDLFVENSRNGRNLEEAIDNTIEEENVRDKDMPDAVIIDSAEQIARFNNYMDAVYRRMNAALRAKLMDPMELNLNPKSDKKERKEKKEAKKRVRRDVMEESEVLEQEEEEEEEQMGEVDRMGTVKKGRKAKNKPDKNKNNKKKNDSKNKNKGDKNKNKNKGGNKGKDKKKGQKKSDRQKKREMKKALKKREKSSRKVGELSRGKRAKHSKGKDDKKKTDDGKSMGSLSGVATLRRSGDVKVEDEKTHILVTSLFSVGPLLLEVSKSLGHGKARTVRTAKATTDVMTGVMVLKVKPDGSAHVKKVVFKKPDRVDVKGSISEKKERSENILKNSFNRSRPLAAQKILKTARYVLKGSSNTSGAGK